MNKAQFRQELEQAIQGDRLEHPIPERSTLSAEQEWQCQVIGGELLSWLRSPLENILGQRHFFNKLMPFDPDPVIVFTTNTPGLVAAQIILGETDKILFLHHASWQRFAAGYKEDLYDRFLVHHWSLFEQAEKDVLEAQAFINFKQQFERLYVHTAGELWGPRNGLQGKHLWAFDKAEGVLLEEAFESIRY